MCEALYQVHEDLVIRTHFSRGKVKEESASHSVMSDSLWPHGLSMGFSRTENPLEWIAILFSRDLPDPGIEPGSLALQADALLSEPPAFLYTNSEKSERKIEESISFTITT